MVKMLKAGRIQLKVVALGILRTTWVFLYWKSFTVSRVGRQVSKDKTFLNG
jgi:hypothetical protein